MVLVYRLEDSEGDHSYCRSLDSFSREDGYDSNYHPSPFEEEGTELGELANGYLNNSNNPNYICFKEHVCGFGSLRQLHRWFPKRNLTQMSKQNPEISLFIYDVPREDVKRGRRQIMFKKHKQSLVATLSPNDLNKGLKYCHDKIKSRKIVK